MSNYKNVTTELILVRIINCVGLVYELTTVYGFEDLTVCLAVIGAWAAKLIGTTTDE